MPCGSSARRAPGRCTGQQRESFFACRQRSWQQLAVMAASTSTGNSCCACPACLPDALAMHQMLQGLCSDLYAPRLLLLVACPTSSRLHPPLVQVGLPLGHLLHGLDCDSSIHADGQV